MPWISICSFPGGSHASPFPRSAARAAATAAAAARRGGRPLSPPRLPRIPRRQAGDRERERKKKRNNNDAQPAAWHPPRAQIPKTGQIMKQNRHLSEVLKLIYAMCLEGSHLSTMPCRARFHLALNTYTRVSHLATLHTPMHGASHACTPSTARAPQVQLITDSHSENV
ncbi:unnamed protein product [Notodromas monacha]|uniref:Uncharacterized protein n=1 Tax=Notodromas monacha TaxID=399045 RepID=A0A7R9BC96_9CRUS|nr:unnamed protein product [Notodromas monacha]CAG0912615.1 unnamed protein product [Notodromas monacha]